MPTEYSPLVFFNDSESDQESSLDHCLNRGVDALLLNCTDGKPLESVAVKTEVVLRESTVPGPVKNKAGR